VAADDLLVVWSGRSLRVDANQYIKVRKALIPASQRLVRTVARRVRLSVRSLMKGQWLSETGVRSDDQQKAAPCTRHECKRPNPSRQTIDSFPLPNLSDDPGQITSPMAW
jgi:hypothetical protein